MEFVMSDDTARFPLTLRADGRYCKKIDGKVIYFGRDRHEALVAYVDFMRSRKVAEMTIAHLIDAYMAECSGRVSAGDLGPRTLAQYQYLGRYAKSLLPNSPVESLTAQDFSDAVLSLGDQAMQSRGNLVRYLNGVLRWGLKNGKITAIPNTGTLWGMPKKRQLRVERNQKMDARFYSRDELRAVIDTAMQLHPQLHAMTLLGINCGFGPTDCGSLTLKEIDWNEKVIRKDRKALGITRVCPLWEETYYALERAIDKRPDPAGIDNAGLVFLTASGMPWQRVNVTTDENGVMKATNINAVSPEFAKIVRTAGVYRKDRGFYALRRTFRTVAANAEGIKEKWVDVVMGHCPSSVAWEHYVRGVDLPQVRRVTEVVRQWLRSDTP